MGVLLFQLVTGRPPFQGATQHEVEDKHLHAPAPRASEYAPVPTALDAVIERCMEKRREARYPDVGAVLEELRRAVRPPAAHGAELAVALYVEARVEGEPGDEALEWLDGVLAHAAQEMEAAGLEVKVDGASCLLALASLGGAAGVWGPSAGGGTHAGGGHRGSKAPSKRRTRAPGPRGGAAIKAEVLRLPDWVVTHPAKGLLATEAALQGLALGLLPRGARPGGHPA